MTGLSCTTPAEFPSDDPLTVTSDAPHISSDSGISLLCQRGDRLRLSERLADVLPDARDPRDKQ